MRGIARTDTGCILAEFTEEEWEILVGLKEALNRGITSITITYRGETVILEPAFVLMREWTKAKNGAADIQDAAIAVRTIL